MTIAADWQAEVRGLTVGASTRYPFTGPITGLGLAAPRTADQERGNEPGDVAGRDVPARRVLTFQMGIDGTDAANAWGLFEALKTAWTSSPVDVALDLRLPGYGSVARRFYGRPRGLEDQIDLLRLGWIDVLATFEALDPYGYGPEIEVALIDGDTVVTHAGTAPTDRWRLELDGDVSPVIFSTGDVDPPLTLVNALGGIVIDGRARTVVDGDDGADLYGNLLPASAWPTLLPGSNTVVLNGGTGSLFYRPAYL